MNVVFLYISRHLTIFISLCMYLGVYIYIYIYRYLYIYIHLYMYVRMYVCMCIYIYIYMFLYAYLVSVATRAGNVRTVSWDRDGILYVYINIVIALLTNPFVSTATRGRKRPGLSPGVADILSLCLPRRVCLFGWSTTNEKMNISQ